MNQTGWLSCCPRGGQPIGAAVLGDVMGRGAMTDFSAFFALLRRSASSLPVSVYEAVGMMTAVVSVPELLLPSDWLNALLREDGLADASDAQAVGSEVAGARVARGELPLSS